MLFRDSGTFFLGRGAVNWGWVGGWVGGMDYYTHRTVITSSMLPTLDITVQHTCSSAD